MRNMFSFFFYHCNLWLLQYQFYFRHYFNIFHAVGIITNMIQQETPIASGPIFPIPFDYNTLEQPIFNFITTIIRICIRTTCPVVLWGQDINYFLGDYHTIISHNAFIIFMSPPTPITSHLWDLCGLILCPKNVIGFKHLPHFS